ncbi:MAG: hypothetical protein WAU78_08235 [Roseiarcus sp.]
MSDHQAAGAPAASHRRTVRGSTPSRRAIADCQPSALRSELR